LWEIWSFLLKPTQQWIIAFLNYLDLQKKKKHFIDPLTNKKTEKRYILKKEDAEIFF